MPYIALNFFYGKLDFIFKDSKSNYVLKLTWRLKKNFVIPFQNHVNLCIELLNIVQLKKLAPTFFSLLLLWLIKIC